MAGSAPSMAGRKNDSAKPMAPMETPNSPTKRSPCQVTFWASSRRPAPKCWATCTEKPTAAALNRPLNSQVVEEVRPTAAVASEPREPTMAVSTYCTRVSMICSMMAGQAKSSTAPRVPQMWGSPGFASMEEMRSLVFIGRSPCRPGRLVPAALQRICQRPRGPGAFGRSPAPPCC